MSEPNITPRVHLTPSNLDTWWVIKQNYCQFKLGGWEISNGNLHFRRIDILRTKAPPTSTSNSLSDTAAIQQNAGVVSSDHPLEYGIV